MIVAIPMKNGAVYIFPHQRNMKMLLEDRMRMKKMSKLSIESRETSFISRTFQLTSTRQQFISIYATFLQKILRSERDPRRKEALRGMSRIEIAEQFNIARIKHSFLINISFQRPTHFRPLTLKYNVAA